MTAALFSQFDADASSRANAAWSWCLRGNRDETVRYLNALTQDQRDAVMEAAVVLVALTGGIEP